ncbi:hypothetical protein ACEPAG_4627 [Sanghuangporus baumii]
MTGMIDAEIFTALNLSAPGPHPSISCAQWSGDGQLVVCTKSAVFILTPDLGINFENPSLLKTDRRNLQEHGSKDPGLDLGWHRNLIELDRNIAHSWASDTQECGGINLGSLDISWRSVAVSPGNLSNASTGSGSLVVVMNTNLELSLWFAAKNHLKEAWTKIQDITSTLKELPPPQERSPQDRHLLLKVLQAQVNCMAWSQQSDFGVRPSILVDGSILALGNRAGSIIFMRYDGERSLTPIRVLQVGDEWVVRLAWGAWKSYEPYYTESFLACGLASGAIVLIYVRQHLEASSFSGSFSPSFTVHVEFSVLDAHPSDPDGRSITALAWIDRPEVSQEKPTLFYAKPGLFHFYRMSVTVTEGIIPLPKGEVLGVLHVQRQATSVDSSPFYPVSGLARLADTENDILIVALFDGSIHAVHDACTSPSMDATEQAQSIGAYDSESSMNGINSTQLSHTTRRAITQAEGGSLRCIDVGRISGVVDFDGLGTILWLHETCRPTDFSYKHEAKHNSMLVVARLWQNPKEHDFLLSYLSRAFERPRSILGHAPSSILRPILLHLCQRKTFDVVWTRVLPLLAPGLDDAKYANGLPRWSRGLDEEIKRAIRRNLAIELYGWDAFHSLRLRLAVADYCWKMASGEEIREQFGTAAQTLLSSISHRFMRILVRHLAAVIESLTEQELPFLMRVIVQSLLAGSPEDLTTEAHALSEATKVKFANVDPDAFGLTEMCPACRSPIPLENLLTAICPNGHTWARCSITSFVLATPMVRTCTGCTRKAFLAPSSRTQSSPGSNTIDPSASVGLPPTSNLWIPDAGRSWFVDELLEAARFCLYCGNRFVRIL